MKQVSYPHLGFMPKLRILLLVFAVDFLGLVLYLTLVRSVLAPTKSSNPVQKFVDTFAKRDVTVILTGDVMLGRSVMWVSLAKEKDPAYPFRKVADTLGATDLTLINLENPVVANCPFSNEGFKFCADPKMIDGLKLGGVDVANIANNHTGNYGKEGFVSTENYLKQAGIDYVGDGNLVIREVNGTRFGFLGFDFLDNVPKQADYDLISESKKKVDVLITAVHWGVEYTPGPTKAQELIAKNMVTAGADVIYGTHPHWVQNAEYLDSLGQRLSIVEAVRPGGLNKAKPVYYSLGNLVFDQMWSEETKKGLVMKLTYRNGELIKEEKMPIYIPKMGQPIFSFQ